MGADVNCISHSGSKAQHKGGYQKPLFVGCLSMYTIYYIPYVIYHNMYVYDIYIYIYEKNTIAWAICGVLAPWL